MATASTRIITSSRNQPAAPARRVSSRCVLTICLRAVARSRRGARGVGCLPNRRPGSRRACRCSASRRAPHRPPWASPGSATRPAARRRRRGAWRPWWPERSRQSGAPAGRLTFADTETDRLRLVTPPPSRPPGPLLGPDACAPRRSALPRTGRGRPWRHVFLAVLIDVGDVHAERRRDPAHGRGPGPAGAVLEVRHGAGGDPGPAGEVAALRAGRRGPLMPTSPDGTRRAPRLEPRRLRTPKRAQTAPGLYGPAGLWPRPAGEAPPRSPHRLRPWRVTRRASSRQSDPWPAGRGIRESTGRYRGPMPCCAAGGGARRGAPAYPLPGRGTRLLRRLTLARGMLWTRASCASAGSR